MVNYKDIGLKSGVEIHQQLNTKKLFCECPSLLREDEPDVVVKRKLRAVAGETGITDIAALHEFEKGKEFVYQGYKDTTCLVELDEEPPHEINKEALEIAIQISILLNAKPVEVSQVMRKTVIDGSNTSGFQRTLLIAKDGFIELENKKKISILAICLEEDAARAIKRTEKTTFFRLDRLGIPLVEIVTGPEISSPEEAKEVALKIGEILRACKVKRGIGTIRQDVNLSIAGGARTEIKGVQEPNLIPKTIESEIQRQLELIKEKKKVDETVRRAEPDGSTAFLRPLPGAARMYPETDVPLVYISKDLIKKIQANLPKLKSEIKSDIIKKFSLNDEYASILINENKTEEFESFAKEFSKISPITIAKILILYPKEIASHEKIPVEAIKEKLTEETIKALLKALAKDEISESSVKSIITEIIKGASLEKAMKKFQVSGISKNEIEKEIDKIIREKPNLSLGAYMGLAMQKLKGKAEGKDISEILKRKIK
jgi:Glu-tRNA(Gln) amidotransferase subunit E-like FAD-binding protein